MTDQCRVVGGAVPICGHLGLPRNRGFLHRWVRLPEWWSLWCTAFAPLLVGFSNPHLRRNFFSIKFPNFQWCSSLFKCHWILNYAKDAGKEDVLPTPPLQMTQRGCNVRGLGHAQRAGKWEDPGPPRNDGPSRWHPLQGPPALQPSMHNGENCLNPADIISAFVLQKQGWHYTVFQKKANGELGKFDQNIWKPWKIHECLGKGKGAVGKRAWCLNPLLKILYVLITFYPWPDTGRKRSPGKKNGSARRKPGAHSWPAKLSHEDMDEIVNENTGFMQIDIHKNIESFYDTCP